MFAYSIAFSLLLLSPFSIPAFTFGGRYVGEVPILLALCLTFFISGGVSSRLVRRAALAGLATTLFLAPFFLWGVIKGASPADAYSDARAMVVLIVLSSVLFQADRESVLRFIVAASMLCLVAYVVAITAGLGSVLLNQRSVETRKITYPILVFVVACQFFAYHRRWLGAVSVVGFAFLVAQTAYRYAYLTLALTVMSCFAAPFLGSRARPWLKWAVTVAAVAGMFLMVPSSRGEAVDLFQRIESRAYNLGVPTQIVQQTVTKNIHNLESEVGQGDAIYLQYFWALLDVRRFAVPRGLGQAASVGDPSIFYGNTVDNTVIFIDYHFGIWATLLLGIVLVRCYRRVTRGLGLLAHAEILMLLSPVVVALYFRAVPFTNLAGAISLAFAIAAISFHVDYIRSRSAVMERALLDDEGSDPATTASVGA